MGPELSFNMALAALLLTLGTIIVTLMNFHKSAGRVTVEMNAALLDPARSLLSNNKGKWGLDTQDHGRRGIELAKIVIENPGRTGATITGVAFRIEGAKDPDLAMGVVPLETRHLGHTTTAIGIPHRLEPYDQVVYLVDFWSAVRSTFADEPNLRQLNILATVKVAGQPHPYTSTNHGYWTIRREWASVVAPYQKQTAQNVILEALTNVFSNSGQNSYLIDIASEVERRLNAESSSTDITTTLQNVLGPGGPYNNRELLGDYDVLSLVWFGNDVKQRFEEIGANLIWSVPLTVPKNSAPEEVTP
ncbi:hypothetical protein [Arthrobacter sp. D5-1]|uniref:hypothetical protein n=1 Tax=Arthrobacter sp. D5-1 TaxID=1477518 RepID=UPI001A99D3AB|nr:hypothetical protein [Arthrobacter sp. D5-1]QSZ49579.1 hypothetical protein AYX22_15000 [Arthrobacter sp. D5-1]